MISFLNSGIISPFGPSKAHLVKFFAAPNPPGITSPSSKETFAELISLILPLAILADSSRTFLLSLVSSPVL